MVEEREPDKNVTGGIGITAGGNVSFGDISGTVIIGGNTPIKGERSEDFRKECTITLSIRETADKQRVFMFNILLDGKVIVSNQSLSPADSQAMRDFSRRYNLMFEQRGQPSIASDNLKALGSELFNIWFVKHWSKITEKIQPGTMRLLVIASDIADILNLPWELMRPPNEDHLGFDLKFSIRRLPWKDRQLTEFRGQLKSSPLRILFMACAPQDQAYLDYEREEESLLKAIGSAGTVAFDSGDMGSFEELRQRINEFKPHVVHLTGHGIVKEGVGYFAFEDEQGNIDLRSSLEIRQQLFAGSSVQCAFISGCQSGKAPPVEVLGGICQGLVGEEIPLAIGWAASIADNISTQFAATFYNTLASGQPVDRALTQARQAIKKLCEQQGSPSWTLPVLYSSTSQGLVFDPHSTPEPPLRKSVVQQPLQGMTEGYAKQFIGRRRELQELLPALRGGSLQTILITGLGGTGKSTLATRLARKLEADGFIPVAVPSSKDNPLNAARLIQICSDAFLEANLHEAYSTLLNAQIPVDSRLRYIVTVLNKNRFLLVLDNFETNMDESTRKILDKELAAFYTHLINNLVGGSRAIITSRYLPSNVDVLPSIAKEKPLGDFPESSFIKFLLLDGIVEQRYYKNEIPYSLLSRLYKLFGGTPRFLSQIREVLKTIKAEDLRNALESVADSKLQQARDKYCEDIFTSRLFSYLKPDSQKALCSMAVYRIPVNMAGIRAVTGEPEDKLQRFVREWQDYALAYPEGELWIVYGLLRNWLLDKVSHDDRRAAHKAAGDFLIELIENNPSLDVALEARSQCILAEDYENAVYITERISSVYRLEGLYIEIQQLNEELLKYYEHPRILNQIAWSYLDRSSYEDARKWYQRMLDAAKGIDGETATALHGLATIDLNQGEYEAARNGFMKVLEIEQQIGDRAGEADTLHQLATIDVYQGDYDAARNGFSKALEIRQQIGDRAGEAQTLHNLASIDVYQGKYDAARNGFSKALEIEQQIGDRAGEASTWYQLGMLAAEMNRLADGIKLASICYLIEHSIGHAYTERDFKVVTEMASRLNYTDEQFNIMLKEVAESYQTDGGSEILEMAFRKD